MCLAEAEIEIDDTEILYRRVKPIQIDEKGNPMDKAFSLRKEIKESYLSVNAASLCTPEEALDKRRYKNWSLYKIDAAVPRTMKLGVAHSPSNGIPSHTAICGFFTSEKSEKLAQSAVKVTY